MFSGIKLNQYYNTSGGIVGKIETIFNPNYVKVENNKVDFIELDFSEIMLEQYSGDKYRAEFITQDYIELDADEQYVIYVNDIPCDISEFSFDYSSDYVISEYHYAFFDEYKEFKLQDTLSFRFAFYGKSTRLIVETNGGYDAVCLWNSYFQKNEFIVTLKTEKNVYINKTEMVNINLYANDKIYDSITIKKGSDYLLPTEVLVDGYVFNYWTDGTSVITSIFDIQEDVNIYADLSEIFQVDFLLNTGTGDANSEAYIYKRLEFVDGSQLSLIESPIRKNYNFIGWSIDKVNVVDFTNYVVTSDLKLYAIWEAADFLVVLDLNSANVMIDGVLYSENTTIKVGYEDVIVFENITFDGNYELENIIVCNSIKSNDSMNVSDITFNLSAKDIYLELYKYYFDENSADIPDFSSMTIKFICKNMDLVENWTDAELQSGVLTEFGYGADGSNTYDETRTNEELMQFLYLQTTGEHVPASMTEYELSAFIVDQVTGSDATFNNSLNYRTALEIIYNYLAG